MLKQIVTIKNTRFKNAQWLDSVCFKNSICEKGKQRPFNFPSVNDGLVIRHPVTLASIFNKNWTSHM